MTPRKVSAIRRKASLVLADYVLADHQNLKDFARGFGQVKHKCFCDFCQAARFIKDSKVRTDL